MSVLGAPPMSYCKGRGMKRCGATYTYTAEDVSQLGLFDEDAGLTTGACDLAPGHEGLHVVDVYLVEEPERDEDYTYLLWNAAVREIRVLPQCSACRLPAGHTDAMWCAHRTGRCTATVELGAHDVDFLARLEDAADTVENPFKCELELGHASGHVSSGQAQESNGETQALWWIVWDGASYEIVNQPDCGAVADPDDEDFAMCLTIAGHEGSHYWV